jgi:hypothetical protein
MLPTEAEAWHWYHTIVREKSRTATYVLFQLYASLAEGPGWVFTGYCDNSAVAQKRAQSAYLRTAAFNTHTQKFELFNPR